MYLNINIPAVIRRQPIYLQVVSVSRLCQSLWIVLTKSIIRNCLHDYNSIVFIINKRSINKALCNEQQNKWLTYYQQFVPTEMKAATIIVQLDVGNYLLHEINRGLTFFRMHALFMILFIQVNCVN